MAYAPDLKFMTNMPATVTFSFGLEARHKFEKTDKFGAAWLYTTQVQEFALNGQIVYAAGEWTLKASEALQGVLERAGIGRDTTAVISKVEEKGEGNKSYTVWRVQNGNQTFTSRDGQAAPPAQAPPTQSTTPAQLPAGQPEPQQLAPTNGHPKPSFTEMVLEVAVLHFRAGEIAKHNCALLGWGEDREAQAVAVIMVALDKRLAKPDDKTVQRFLQARAKSAPAPTDRPPASAKPPGAPATGQGSPAGSPPIGADGYFVLLDATSAAKIAGNRLHDEMAARWRAFLKAAPDSPLPTRGGPDPDFSLFPEVLAQGMMDWIEAEGERLAAAQMEAGDR